MMAAHKKGAAPAAVPSSKRRPPNRHATKKAPAPSTFERKDGTQSRLAGAASSLPPTVMPLATSSNANRMVDLYRHAPPAVVMVDLHKQHPRQSGGDVAKAGGDGRMRLQQQVDTLQTVLAALYQQAANGGAVALAVEEEANKVAEEMVSSFESEQEAEKARIEAAETAAEKARAEVAALRERAERAEKALEQMEAAKEAAVKAERAKWLATLETLEQEAIKAVELEKAKCQATLERLEQDAVKAMEEEIAKRLSKMGKA